MRTLYYVVFLVIGHGATSLPNVFCSCEQEVTYCATVSSMVCILFLQLLCTAQATQLSYARRWCDLDGVFHTQ